jgi:hypothetical protein
VRLPLFKMFPIRPRPRFRWPQVLLLQAPSL